MTKARDWTARVLGGKRGIKEGDKRGWNMKQEGKGPGRERGGGKGNGNKRNEG